MATLAKPMKIALTGGPSAGKTSTVEMLSRSYSQHFCVIPEAASILFRGGFPRIQESDHVKCQQRAIYYTQRELENVGLLDPSERHLICDRGSLDTLAYWPGDEAGFFESIGSCMEEEIQRYDWVIHLDTVIGQDYQMTTLRTESNELALELNEKIKHAWRMHPRRFVIHDSREFILKMNITIRVIDLILQGANYEDICKEVSGPDPATPLRPPQG